MLRYETTPTNSTTRRWHGDKQYPEVTVLNPGRARLMDDLIGALYDLYKNDVYSIKRCAAALWCDEVEMRRVFKAIDKKVAEMKTTGEMKFLQKQCRDVLGEKSPFTEEK